MTTKALPQHIPRYARRLVAVAELHDARRATSAPSDAPPVPRQLPEPYRAADAGRS